MALSHSFFYTAAAKAFAAATEKDAACAMGSWGIAMSQWYPLWFPPNEADTERPELREAKAFLAKK